MKLIHLITPKKRKFSNDVFKQYKLTNLSVRHFSVLANISGNQVYLSIQSRLVAPEDLDSLNEIRNRMKSSGDEEIKKALIPFKRDLDRFRWSSGMVDSEAKERLTVILNSVIYFNSEDSAKKFIRQITT